MERKAKSDTILKFASPLAIFTTSYTALTFLFGIIYPEYYKGLGTWGDYINGVLTPVLTLITFLSVLITLGLQREELNLTREEMARTSSALEKQEETQKKQAFEATFFEMLKIHNDILDSIDLVNKETGLVTRGRDAFNIFYNRLTKQYRKNYEKGKRSYSKREIAELSYFNFWQGAQTELGHYFRYLFNFFRFIENNGPEDDFYARLLRSQLSNQELLILYYNNICSHGEPFRHFANLYALFDNLPVIRLMDRDHVSFADPEAFGKNPMAWISYQPSAAALNSKSN